MSRRSAREIYFSFFMFTADLRPKKQKRRYTKVLIRHMRKLAEMGYDGFDLHIAAQKSLNPAKQVNDYRRLKDAFDKARINQKFATNVGTTEFYDPTSPSRKTRELALNYLKSRVDITKVLGGDGAILSGPFLYPYGVFPKPLIWGDALQDWIKGRYENARPVFEEFAEYAAANKVKLALEPVKNWETPPPNMVSEALDFVERLKSAPCGITVDTAQVLMESQGPEVFKQNVARAAKRDLLNYVHISPPDRGAVHDCWIPWDLMLGQLDPVFQGPYLIEIFNAIPPFDELMRMSRRPYWRPGEDAHGRPERSAYFIAEQAIKELRRQLDRVGSSSSSEAASHRKTNPGKVKMEGSAHDDAESFPFIVSLNDYGEDNAVRIHTFIASYTENNIANATHIIESANALVVVDGQFLAPYARQFREYANRLNKPIARVYLSHRHPDHWFGMPTAFSDQSVYALAKTIEWVAENGKVSLAKHAKNLEEKLGKDAAAKLVPTTHQFKMKPVAAHEETIDGVKYVFEEECDAEVEAQLTIKLPEVGVAIVQDLIYSGTHLYLTKAMDHWRKILQKLSESNGYETFLAGHGMPADRKELAANIEYLIAAQHAFDGGMSKVNLQQFLVARYPARLGQGIFPIYLPRLYGEAPEV